MSAVTGNGLRDLQRVELGDGARRLWERQRTLADGDPVWRARKGAEARDLLALAEIASRLEVEFLDLRGDLRALLRLRAPVPCRVPSGPLSIAGAARVGLVYPRAAIWQALPGVAFASLLHPVSAYHPNVHAGAGQRMCLGPRLPAGTRLTEIVLLVYRALTLQEVTVDERDPAGVLNVDAARYWQAHLAEMPLTAAPFLDGQEQEEIR